MAATNSKAAAAAAIAAARADYQSWYQSWYQCIDLGCSCCRPLPPGV